MPRTPVLPLRQRGASLIYALLALVALGLATLALVRSVDFSALALGNMSFKQDATAAGDQAVQAAFAWLSNQTSATLGADQEASGYYASTREEPTIPTNPSTRPAALDVTGQQYPDNPDRQLVDWGSGDADDPYTCPVSGHCTLASANAGATPNGHNRMRYVIFRLCALTDAQAVAAGATNNCATLSANASGNHEAGEVGLSSQGSGAYYRIVARVRGSRNSTSFIETIVQL